MLRTVPDFDRMTSEAVEAEVVGRGCDVLLIAAPGGGPPAALLAGAGWQAAGEPVADGRKLWRRELQPSMAPTTRS